MTVYDMPLRHEVCLSDDQGKPKVARQYVPLPDLETVLPNNSSGTTVKTYCLLVPSEDGSEV